MSRPISAITTSHDLGGSRAQPRHLGQPLDGVAKGRKCGLDARIECRHRLLQLLDGLQMLIEKKAVMVPDTAVERLDEGVSRAAETPAAEFGARCRSPRNTRPCACGSTDRAVLRARPWSWRSTLGRLLPRSRRTRLRAEPLAGGRRTRDPVSAASRTTSPSGRPDDPPADPSP